MTVLTINSTMLTQRNLSRYADPPRTIGAAH